MRSIAPHKSWVSPITALSFVAVGGTGVLMLFHVRAPGIQGVHQWMGVVLAAMGTLHLILNWRAFLCHFRHRSAIVALAASLALCLGALLLPADGEHHGHGPGGRPDRPVDADGRRP
jgi:hypothetical protein